MASILHLESVTSTQDIARDMPIGSIVMADHQTAGGYPRLAHVIGSDLPLLGQLGATDKVAFHLVEPVEAENASLAFEKELNFLKTGVRFTANS